MAPFSADQELLARLDESQPPKAAKDRWPRDAPVGPAFLGAYAVREE
jgi:hypothetical protein